MRKLFKVILMFVVCCVLVVGGYVAYLTLSYSRIDDYLQLTTLRNPTEPAFSQNSFTLITYNAGFGAYTNGFSYFLDKEITEDGNVVAGKQARASSRTAIVDTTNKQIEELNSHYADFYFLQEVDVNSDRSYHVNQAELFENAFGNYGAVYAENNHSSYLLYPLLSPVGRINSGILTLSRFQVSTSLRRQLPITTDLLQRLVALDNCFVITRVTLSNEKELVLINLHMSTYNDTVSSKERMSLLNLVMKQEYDNGNYVVVGGDFNMKIASTMVADEQEDIVLSDDDLPTGFSIIHATNVNEVSSYSFSNSKEEAIEYMMDGFIVSDNIVARAEIIDTKFSMSDHNPVKISFSLLD